MFENIFSSIRALAEGGIIAIEDDIAPTQGVYLVQGATAASAESIAFMVREARGVICAAITEDRALNMALPAMARSLRYSGLPMTVSIESRHGVSTGISAQDRAHTLRVLATSEHQVLDLVMPGHIFPMRARKGGVLVNHDIWEAAVDLASSAGLEPTCAVVHCLTHQGELMGIDQSRELCRKYSLPHTSIKELIAYLLSTRRVVELVTTTHLPTPHGVDFKAYCYRSVIDQSEHLALSLGDILSLDEVGQQEPVLARVQAENRLGDLLGPSRLPTRHKLACAIKQIQRAGRGILVYVRHPRQGKLVEWAETMSEPTANGRTITSVREFGIGLQIMCLLGLKRLRLISSSSHYFLPLEAFGIEAVETLSLAQLEDLPHEERLFSR